MEVSTYFGDNLAVTGSEESFSHKGTYNIDLGIIGKGTRKRYAPFTCVVKAVDPKYGTLVCESVNKVISPRYQNGEFLCFSVGHLDKLRFKVGDIIPQGAFLGEDSMTGTTEKHTHWSFGVGKLKMPHYLTRRGTYRTSSGEAGIYALACTVGWIHSYDFWYIPKDTPITTAKDNPAYKYPWKRLDERKKTIVTVRGELIKQDGDVFTIKGGVI